MTIRPATIADFDVIVELVEHFLAASIYAKILGPADRETLEKLVGAVMDTGVILLAEGCAGDVEGMLALAVFDHPVTGIPYADELAWWVEPHARGSLGPRLLAAGEAWVKARGLSGLKMVAPADSSVGRLYARRGYVEVETAYHKRFT